MKRFLLNSLGVCCILISSCTDTENAAIDPQKRSTNSAIALEPSVEDVYENLDVTEYIQQNYGLFGNVLVFDSIEEAITLLNVMQQSTYNELKVQYQELGYKNVDMESILLFDSLENEAYNMFGYTSEEDIEQAGIGLEYDTVFEQLAEENNERLKIYYEMNEDGESVGYIEPYGNFDFTLLTNEKGIFIADKVVYKFIDNNLITIPLHKYYAIASVNTSDNLQVFIAENTPDLQQGTDFVVSPAQNAAALSFNPQDYARTQTSFETITSNSKLQVELTARETWAWFNKAKIVSKATITNCYRRGNNTKMKRTKLATDYNIQFNAVDPYTGIFNEAVFIGNDNIKNTTFKQGSEKFAVGNYADIIIVCDVSVYVQNSANATILY